MTFSSLWCQPARLSSFSSFFFSSYCLWGFCVWDTSHLEQNWAVWPKKCPRRHSRKYVAHLWSAAMKKRKKERKKTTFALSHFEPRGALYCISETTTREPLDQQNWKTVFMRSNGSLSWNTLSVCIYPLWDNISSYCWLFHVYTFHSFMMQISLRFKNKFLQAYKQPAVVERRWWSHFMSRQVVAFLLVPKVSNKRSGEAAFCFCGP